MTQRSTINTILHLVTPLFIVHALLRVIQLARVDAYGNPFVGKFEWFIFHAFAFDFKWIVLTTIPFIFIALFTRPRVNHVLIAFFIICHSLLLIGTAIDNETYRFLGGHLSLNLLNTYGNATSLWETFGFILEDRSIPFLPLILTFFSVPFFLKLRSYFQKAEPIPTSRYLILFVLFFIISHLYTAVIWYGGHRQNKLRPFIITVWNELTASEFTSITPNEEKAITKTFQEEWLTIQGDSSFLFIDSGYPYIKTPLFTFCTTHPSSPACLIDRDQDGFLAKFDCDDFDPLSHPGGVDVASNGIDEDCNGVDTKPMNIIYLILESHRAINNGYLKPYGASGDATPFQNKLAPNAHYWTRLMTSGVPTIAALTTTHMSLHQHTTKFLATAYPQLLNKSFPKILREHGYRADFFSTADPAWDNQTPWLSQWYDEVHYDRSRETDASMFEHMGKWLKKNVSTEQPFIATAITKVNHYPFNAASDMTPHPDGASLQDKLKGTMNYTENAIEKLFESVKNEPWFSNTLFIITADHGFSLGEHANSSIAEGKFLEITWVPFLIFGNHPELGTPRPHLSSANQFDIAPTLLDLAGITTRNHFIGHSLIRPNTEKNNLSFFSKSLTALIEKDSLLIHIPLKQEDSATTLIFNRITDPGETRNLYPLLKDSIKPLYQYARNRSNFNAWLIEKNKIWSEVTP